MSLHHDQQTLPGMTLLFYSMICLTVQKFINGAHMNMVFVSKVKITEYVPKEKCNL